MRPRRIGVLALLSLACSAEPRGGELPSLGSPGPECRLVEEGFGPDGAVAVRAEEVARGLEVPWGILFLGGGDMIVTERPGRLRWVRDGELASEPLAEIEALARGEGGLLGVAAHPEFAQNGLFYLYLTVRSDGRATNRVEQWRFDDAGPRAERVRVLLGDIPAARFHNGGRLRVGPDRHLYVGTGDAQSPRLAQDERSLAGKILRLRLDGSIPGDNPHGAAWVMGLRNTQGFDWREDGALVVADHGPSGELGRRGHDEISVARRGANLGWPLIYGCRTGEGMVTPSLSWREAVPPGGAAIYTGNAIGAWRGSLLVGTLGSRHLHRVTFEPGSARVRSHEVYLREELGRIREVVMGPDGHLYLTTSNCDGRGTCPPEGDAIYRVLPA